MTTNDKVSNTMTTTKATKIVCHKDGTVSIQVGTRWVRRIKEVSEETLAGMSAEVKTRVLHHTGALTPDYALHSDGTVTFFSIYNGWQRRVHAKDISLKDYQSMGSAVVDLISSHRADA